MNDLSPLKLEALNKELSLITKSSHKINIEKLIKLGCYRGSRHKLGYPARGQRTR